PVSRWRREQGFRVILLGHPNYIRLGRWPRQGTAHKVPTEPGRLLHCVRSSARSDDADCQHR
ncbi:MAG TPA: hypothetical protein VLY63_08735, partial [Anaerolineae bacterium]|nr:hypothetical protein [Anaerolineae bacterium]